MRSVELFTGAGGLAIGMARSGFKHEVVIERDHDSCETIRLNQRRGLWPVADWTLNAGDVEQFDYATISSGIDLVAGGPPCQPFSLGGKHAGQNDARNMFPQAVRAVRELKPRAFIFENVKGLLRENFTRFFNYVLLQLEFPDCVRKPREEWTDHHSRLQRLKTEGLYDGLRYNIVVDLLNAANFGAPQRRERVFIVGFRPDVQEKWCFPRPTHSREVLLREMWITGDYWDRHRISRGQRPCVDERNLAAVHRLQEFELLPNLKPWRTVRDGLVGLPDPVKCPKNHVPNHVFNPGARSYPGHTGSPLDEPAKTLKAGDHGVPGGENMILLPDGSVRYFTTRESARMQEFPDEFEFYGSWTESMRQIGNAVPVTLGEVVGKSVANALKRASHITEAVPFPMSGTDNPIYVGKADPATLRAETVKEQGDGLWKRLSDHRKSIAAATNLKSEDFDCRYLVVKSAWQETAEDNLIALFKPIWNNEMGICYGFGKHGDAAKTRANRRSPWDTLHPGRKWALTADNVPNEKSAPEILAAIAGHFAKYPPIKKAK